MGREQVRWGPKWFGLPSALSPHRVGRTEGVITRSVIVTSRSGVFYSGSSSRGGGLHVPPSDPHEKLIS